VKLRNILSKREALIWGGEKLSCFEIGKDKIREKQNNATL